MRTILRLTVIVLAVAGFAALVRQPAAGAQERKKITIGLVAKSQSNAVFQAAYSGAKDAAKELGQKYNADVTIDWQTPTDEDAQKQAQAIDSLVRSGAQGIAVSCTEANTVTPAINRAVSAGVTVVTFDSDAPRSRRIAYYGTDDATCGKVVMEELAKAMGNKGTIAILAGNQSAPNLQARVKAVREELKKHAEMKELNDGNGVFYHPETPEDAVRAVQSAQTTNPGIQGWAMIGGWPLFTKGALKWQPGSVKVVSVDALPAQLPYVEEGYVEALYAQDCYGWGYKSVEILLDKIANGKDPSDKRIIDPLTKVTKENAAEYGKKWDKWLGK
ncbi:MAG TPA: substrate-binding domain-containing protein [Tepidisphaeraceae bacterium]|nr:substrate-binding domain-containing protein [Tepidisphaeraceae bacterium]